MIDVLVEGYWSVSELKKAQVNDKNISKIIKLRKDNHNSDLKIDNLHRYIINNEIITFQEGYYNYPRRLLRRELQNWLIRS